MDEITKSFIALAISDISHAPTPQVKCFYWWYAFGAIEAAHMSRAITDAQHDDALAQIGPGVGIDGVPNS